MIVFSVEYGSKTEYRKVFQFLDSKRGAVVSKNDIIIMVTEYALWNRGVSVTREEFFMNTINRILEEVSKEEITWRTITDCLNTLTASIEEISEKMLECEEKKMDTSAMRETLQNLLEKREVIAKAIKPTRVYEVDRKINKRVYEYEDNYGYYMNERQILCESFWDESPSVYEKLMKKLEREYRLGSCYSPEYGRKVNYIDIHTEIPEYYLYYEVNEVAFSRPVDNPQWCIKNPVTMGEQPTIYDKNPEHRIPMECIDKVLSLLQSP